MCNVNQNVMDVVQEFVDNGNVFTAYDVTTEARKRVGRQVNIRHNESREYLRDLMNGSNLSQTHEATLVTLNVTGNPQALVYAPIGADPFSHPMAVRPADVQDDGTNQDDDTTQTDTGNTDTDTGNDDEDDDLEYFITTECRLEIPTKFLKQCPPVGGSYDINFNGNIVSKKPDGSGRVRLPRKLVEGHTYKISVDSARALIVVENAKG